MKNRWNSISCFGMILFMIGIGIAGLFTLAYWYILNVLQQPVGDTPLQLIAGGGVMVFIGVICLYFQFSRVGKWNSLVRYVKAQGEVTMEEAGEKVGVSPKKAKDIIYEAVQTGDLSGTIRGNVFTRGQPAVIERVTEQTRVLVVCPYCGAKNEQGVTRCHGCDGAI
ncbi:MAG: hypothetical protein ACXAEF_11365 [Candidatus Thorarchaeota archaeon]|jgi:hypothetical protein